MVVAEQIRELVRLIAHRAKDLRPAVPQEPEVVPEILDSLSPLVNVLGCGLAAGVAEAGTTSLVGSLQARGQKLPSRLRIAPVIDGRASRQDLAGRASRQSTSLSSPRRSAPRPRRLAPTRGACGAHRRPWAADRRISRPAHPGSRPWPRPRGTPPGSVRHSGGESSLADRSPRRFDREPGAGRRASSSGPFASRGWPFRRRGPSAQLVQSVVQPPARDPRDRLGRLLSVLDPISAGGELLSWRWPSRQSPSDGERSPSSWLSGRYSREGKKS